MVELFGSQQSGWWEAYRALSVGVCKTEESLLAHVAREADLGFSWTQTMDVLFTSWGPGA